MMLFLRRRASAIALAGFGFLAVATAHAATGAAPFNILDAWVRVPPAGGHTGAAYMKIKNTGGQEDRLTGGSTPVAKTVQVHEMTMTNGVMDMHEVVGGLVLPAHGTVTLAPGGYHIMLIDLTRPIKTGDDVPLTLHFAKAGDITIHASAKEPPSGNSMGGMSEMSNMGHAK